MQVATEVSQQKLATKVGKHIQVLVDDFDEESGYARSQADAPEIDGVVYLPPPQDCDKPYTKGSMLMVEVEDSSEHDLWAYPI
jgi:ribosomal protein S12 methylthiotransferase